MTSPNIPLLLLTVPRIFVGVVGVLFPEKTATEFGLNNDKKMTLEAKQVTRMFGVRDFVLGAFLLSSKDQSTTKTLLEMGLLVDTVDIIGGVVGYFKGLNKIGVAGLVFGAGTFAGLATYLLKTKSY